MFSFAPHSLNEKESIEMACEFRFSQIVRGPHTANVRCVCCIRIAAALAQRTTGTLRGQVLDPQGAVVANANVTVTNEATGASQVLQ